MSPFRQRMTSMTGRYDQALQYARDHLLPPDAPRPHPTCDWPPENRELLERYASWLAGGGASEAVIRNIYIPMAGHALGLCLKPHSQIDLDADLAPALDYIQAKGSGPDWLKTCQNALHRFRRFLLHERGRREHRELPDLPAPHTDGLPDWLAAELEQYFAISQRGWRDARLDARSRAFWHNHLRIWRYLVEQCGVRELSDVRRKHLNAFAGLRLADGSAVTSINHDLRLFTGFMGFLQGRDYPVPQALLKLRGLKEPERLPKHLTDEQVRLLRDAFERKVQEAKTNANLRDALLDRAVFYLLWQAALRKGEVEELRLEDLDLSGRRLSVRQGKGLKDRNVYLTDTSVQALRAYLERRGQGDGDHVFLYRHLPLNEVFIWRRLNAAGERMGVKVSPHRLRHTAATQLLNAGCPVTSIQKLLGHKKLNTTMSYARAHDQTVEQDYFTAMGRVEQRLEVTAGKNEPAEPVGASERKQLLALTERLAEPELSFEARLELTAVMRGLLVGTIGFPVESGSLFHAHSPPVAASSKTE